HRIQLLVKMGHVVSAIEIVVDKNLPVAMNVVAPAIEEVQLADPQRRPALDQSAKELLQRHRLLIKVRENKALPSAHSNRHQAVLRTVEVLHAIELRHSLQRSIQPVPPAVIRT